MRFRIYSYLLCHILRQMRRDELTEQEKAYPQRLKIWIGGGSEESSGEGVGVSAQELTLRKRVYP